MLFPFSKEQVEKEKQNALDFSQSRIGGAPTGAPFLIIL